MARSWRFVVLVSALVMVSAACSRDAGGAPETEPDASAVPPTTAQPAPSPSVPDPTTSSPDEPPRPTEGDVAPPEFEVRCGAVVVVDGTLPDTPLDEEIAGVLADLDELIGGEAELFSRYDWSLAERSEERFVLFGRPIDEVDPAGPPYADATFEMRDGQWQPIGWGQCHLLVAAEGYGTASVVLDPDHEPDPAAATLAVLVNERNCAGGQVPEGREVRPVVVADEHQIVITVLVEPVAGDASCPSNPWFPLTIELAEQLGTRTILDGHAVPALPLTWPPAQDALGF